MRELKQAKSRNNDRYNGHTYRVRGLNTMQDDLSTDPSSVVPISNRQELRSARLKKGHFGKSMNGTARLAGEKSIINVMIRTPY